jgi:hypothetical protein
LSGSLKRPKVSAPKPPSPVTDWQWLRDFLQTETNLAAVLKTFPDDEPMRRCHRERAADCACCGRNRGNVSRRSFSLRRKQIVQIRQIVALLWKTFPTPQRLAALTEAELRACKMGFRAPNLLAAARQIAEGKLIWKKSAGCRLRRSARGTDETARRGREDCRLRFALRLRI